MKESANKTTINKGSDEYTQEVAVKYIRDHKKDTVKNVVGDVMPAKKAVAIFMAGSPGAGKTEFSIHFLAEQFAHNSIVRIDPDKIREELPGYNGKNAYLFQGAVSLAIEKILDYVFRKNIHFLLDGTFAHLRVARKNIKRAIKKDRFVQINYVY
jgi:predicted ABC-type ATPase